MLKVWSANLMVLHSTLFPRQWLYLSEIKIWTSTLHVSGNFLRQKSNFFWKWCQLCMCLLACLNLHKMPTFFHRFVGNEVGFPPAHIHTFSQLDFNFSTLFSAKFCDSFPPKKLRTRMITRWTPPRSNNPWAAQAAQAAILTKASLARPGRSVVLGRRVYFNYSWYNDGRVDQAARARRRDPPHVSITPLPAP